MTGNPFISTTSGLAPTAGNVGTPGAITGTSTTSQTIADGVLQFQVQAQAAWSPGMFVSIVSQALSSNYMIGVVQAYSGTTLTVDVLNFNGAGTFNAWYVNLTGPVVQGANGATGATGATGAAAGPVNASALGLKVTNDSGTPNTKIDITALAATMVNTSGTSLRATAVSVVIDLTTGTSTSTANGMDGEARGTSAWIYTYLINNGTTTAGLATKTSPLSGTPTMPAGYTSALYTGAMYVDSSGNLLRSTSNGPDTTYNVTASTNTASMPLIANGAIGSVSTPTYVSESIASVCPPTTSLIYLTANGDVGSTAASMLIAPSSAFGTAVSTNPPPIVVPSGGCTTESLAVNGATSLFLASSSSGGYLFCTGWHDYCVAA